MVWVVLGAAATMVYFFNYDRPSYLPGPDRFFLRPTNAAKFVFFYLGRPFTERPAFGVLIGLLLAVMFFFALLRLMIIDRDRIETATPWVAFGIYSLGSALLTGIGRAGVGWEAAGRSRYTTLALLFAISTTVLLGIVLKDRGPRQAPALRSPFLSLLVLPAVVLMLRTPTDVAAMQVWRSHKETLQSCLQDRVPSDPCLGLGHSDKRLVREGVQYLKKAEWGGMRSVR